MLEGPTEKVNKLFEYMKKSCLWIMKLWAIMHEKIGLQFRSGELLLYETVFLYFMGISKILGD